MSSRARALGKALAQNFALYSSTTSGTKLLENNWTTGKLAEPCCTTLRSILSTTSSTSLLQDIIEDNRASAKDKTLVYNLARKPQQQGDGQGLGDQGDDEPKTMLQDRLASAALEWLAWRSLGMQLAGCSLGDRGSCCENAWSQYSR